MTGDSNDLSEVKTNIAVILERTKCLPDMDERMREMDKKISGLCARVTHNEKDIEGLQKKSDTWDLWNSLGAGIAAIIAGLAGFFGSR